MATLSAKVELTGRDCLELSIETDDGGTIVQARLKGTGCPDLLRALEKWRPQICGRLDRLPTPQGEDHATIMMRELIWRVQGKWEFPYSEDELCHCRAVATRFVDEAIVAGAHTSQEVSRQTSASTGCGTCRPTVEAIIDFRLQRKTKKD